MPSTRDELPDPLEPEAHPERLARAPGTPPLARPSTRSARDLTELGQLGPVALELLALRVDDLGRRLGDEAVVGELAFSALRSRLERERARRGARTPRRLSTSSDASTSSGPTAASASPPSASKSRRARRATNSGGCDPSPTRAGRTLGGATPHRSRQRRTSRTSSIAAPSVASASSSNRLASAAGNSARSSAGPRCRACSPRSPRSRTASPDAPARGPARAREEGCDRLGRRRRRGGA